MSEPSLDAVVKRMIDYAETNSHGISLLNTKQELKNFYLEGLEKYTTWKAIASIEDWLPVDKEFLQDFRQKLDDRGIDTRIIMKESGLAYEPKGFKHRTVRATPPTYTFRSSIDILDDKLLIMNPDLNVLGLVIEIESVHNIFNDVFDLLWGILPPVSPKN